MPLPSHSLIESVTEPLEGDLEQRMAARSLFQETIIPEHSECAHLVRRMAEISAGRSLSLGAVITGLGVVIALACALLVQKSDMQVLPPLSRRAFFPMPERPEVSPDLTAEQSLLLGDPTLSELEQKELLYRSDPENPAFYYEYLLAYVTKYDALPPDETGEICFTSFHFLGTSPNIWSGDYSSMPHLTNLCLF